MHMSKQPSSHLRVLGRLAVAASLVALAAQSAWAGGLDSLEQFVKGTRSVLTFTGFEVNAAVPASHFSFVPPKGADVLKQ